ncbi:MAG: sigma-70 family RNA polymerase sigma factor [Dethiosulfatibacter sp.]|nr:sigma-70 family RNA polymerase sigma factor [Dethiosulfatibacter sp.]
MENSTNQSQPKNKDFYDGAWHLTIEDQVIEVTEEVYRAYKQPLWAEKKRQEREKRCIISDGKGGTKRCTRNCRECDLERAEKGLPLIDRTGSVLSLDKFSDDGFDVPSSVSVTELIEDKFLLEDLFAALDELDPENRRIAELYSLGMPEREIAERIGCVQKTVNNRKLKIFAQLREALKDWM